MQPRDMRPQHLHVIANLRHCADRRARRFDCIALLDGDSRWDSLDAVHLWLVHAIEKLPRVRGERFDVTPLALREQRVKRKRTLARPAQTSHDDQLVCRQIEIEIFKIVVADTPEADDTRRL